MISLSSVGRQFLCADRPGNAVIPDGRHVVVARGRDYPDVTPIKGIYSGSASSRMFVEVQIRRLG